MRSNLFVLILFFSGAPLWGRSALFEEQALSPVSTWVPGSLSRKPAVFIGRKVLRDWMLYEKEFIRKRDQALNLAGVKITEKALVGQRRYYDQYGRSRRNLGATVVAELPPAALNALGERHQRFYDGLSPQLQSKLKLIDAKDTKVTIAWRPLQGPLSAEHIALLIKEGERLANRYEPLEMFAGLDTFFRHPELEHVLVTELHFATMLAFWEMDNIRHDALRILNASSKHGRYVFHISWLYVVKPLTHHDVLELTRALRRETEAFLQQPQAGIPFTLQHFGVETMNGFDERTVHARFALGQAA